MFRQFFRRRLQHFHNTFTTNPRWAVFTSSNLNLPQKSLFCSPITTSNNLLFKVYLWNCCENFVKIAFFEILWFNLQRTKILERSNFILNGLKVLFRVFKFYSRWLRFFFLRWSTTHINLKFKNFNTNWKNNNKIVVSRGQALPTLEPCTMGGCASCLVPK